MYYLLSDCELLRLRLLKVFDFVSCNQFNNENSRIPWFRYRPYLTIEIDEIQGSMQKWKNLRKYTKTFSRGYYSIDEIRQE
jgi:hypothetical protein